MNDRGSRLGLEITEKTVVEKPHTGEIKSTKPEVVTETSSEPARRKETCESYIAKGEAELKTSITTFHSGIPAKLIIIVYWSRRIVNKAEWLGSPANIKGANKDAKS